jgi:hypothetical protein
MPHAFHWSSVSTPWMGVVERLEAVVIGVGVAG